MFQFHTGSIKSIWAEDINYQNPVFQFHTGSIKSKGYSPLPAEIVTFQFHTGSIKRKIPLLQYCRHCKFQFHTGSIKRRTSIPEMIMAFVSFNSILVQLKGNYINKIFRCITVSIPYWFN